MTPEEHLLMVTIFAKQLQLNEALIELLRSRGVAEDDDVKAFHALVRMQPDADDKSLLEAQRVYLAYAKILGVKVGP